MITSPTQTSKKRKEVIISFLLAIVFGCFITTLLDRRDKVLPKPLHFATICDPYSSSNDTYLTRLIGSVHYWHPHAHITVYLATESDKPEQWSHWQGVSWKRASPVSRDPLSDRKTELRSVRAEIYRTFPNGPTIYIDSRAYLKSPISTKIIRKLEITGSMFLDETEIQDESSVKMGSCIPSLDIFGVTKESSEYDTLGNVLNECVRGVCKPETVLQDKNQQCERLDLVLEHDAFVMHSRYCIYTSSPREQNRLDCAFLRPLELISSIVTKNFYRDDITKIALLIPSTTKGAFIESVWELPLLNTFLPSFLRTIATCNREDKETFHFAIYLAYDVLDAFYDRPIAVQTLRIAFDLVIQESQRLFGSRNTPSVELRLYRSHGTKGAPCWIWNSLASKAYDDGFDYFYQLNDDIEFVTKCWATQLVSSLRDSDRPYFGIAGPRDGNNDIVMTQSFVHRTHLDVFDGMYYPTVFKNWYSDNWANRVYGKKNTHHKLDILVNNRQNLGTRYTEHREALLDLEPELKFGRVLIRQWLLNRNSHNIALDDVDDDVPQRDMFLLQEQQLSPQRIYFQEMEERKKAWESEEGLSSTMNWLWILD